MIEQLRKALIDLEGVDDVLESLIMADSFNDEQVISHRTALKEARVFITLQLNRLEREKAFSWSLATNDHDARR